MSPVKRVLLGSAAGIVAMTGAQLPAGAEPVQYVKICSLYGAGFYYIPGTDTCIKIGGYVRAEYNYNAGGSFTPVTNGANAVYNRTSALETLRARIKVTVDVRSETEYGTLRAFGNFASTFTTPATAAPTTAGSDRAFIQFAGFTVGQAYSFFDYFQWTWYSNQSNFISTDTGGAGSGWLLAAYTAQLGNGFSATISVEDPRRAAILDTANAGTLAATGAFTSSYAGFNGFPDIVANLRVDQSWGSAQIMGAVHDVSASYYTGVAGTNVPPVSNVGTAQGNGYPGNEVGWAAGAGIFLNLPMLAPGDNIAAQFTYAQGATAFVVNRSFGIFQGATAGVGWSTDAVFNSGVPGSGSTALSGLELTEAWNVMGGFQHVWNPQWKTSLYGGYVRVDYGDTATGWLNGVTGFSGSPDFAFWQVGSRTVWTPVLNLDLSVDVMYNKIETAYAGNTFVTAVASKPAAGNEFGDQDVWAFILRAQRNFWP